MEVLQVSISDEYRIAAMDWVDAEAAASMLEDTKSSVLAEMMMPHLEDGCAINRAEQQVKASPEWKTHVRSITEARKAANRCKVTLEYLKMRFQEWQSHEANNRLEAKL
jgi:hypothetical protein